MAATIMGTIQPIVMVIGPDGVARYFVQNPLPIACPQCGRHQTLLSLEITCPNAPAEEQQTMGFLQPAKDKKAALKTKSTRAVGTAAVLEDDD